MILLTEACRIIVRPDDGFRVACGARCMENNKGLMTCFFKCFVERIVRMLPREYVVCAWNIECGEAMTR